MNAVLANQHVTRSDCTGLLDPHDRLTVIRLDRERPLGHIQRGPGVGVLLDGRRQNLQRKGHDSDYRTSAPTAGVAYANRLRATADRHASSRAVGQGSVPERRQQLVGTFVRQALRVPPEVPDARERGPLRHIAYLARALALQPGSTFHVKFISRSWLPEDVTVLHDPPR